MKIFNLAVIGIAVLSMSSHGFALGPYEEDDTPEHARFFRVNDDLQTKAFETKCDEDWVVFSLINGVPINITTDNVSPYSSNNTYIEVYGSSILDDPYAPPVYCDERTDPGEYDSLISFDPFGGETGYYYARVLYKNCWDANDTLPPDNCGIATLKEGCVPEDPLIDYTYDLSIADPEGPGATVGGYVFEGTPQDRTELAGVIVEIDGFQYTTTPTGHYSIEVPNTGYLDVSCNPGVGYAAYNDEWYITGNLARNIYITKVQQNCGTLGAYNKNAFGTDFNLSVPFVLLPALLIFMRSRKKKQ